MELRVPPNNVASVQLLTRTIAVSCGVFSPFIASLNTPIPYTLLLSIAFCALLASSALPPPGHHLPKVAETSDAKMKIVEGEEDEPTMLQDFDQTHVVPPTSLVHHAMSHSMTFTETRLLARRPTLTLNRLDPQVYLDQTYANKRISKAVDDVKDIVARIRK